jgi:uncharacterized cofD-like protein
MSPVQRWRQWLRPGMKLKRWIAVTLFGLCMALLGVPMAFDQESITAVQRLRRGTEKIISRVTETAQPAPARVAIGAELILFGIIVCAAGLVMSTRAVAEMVNPRIGPKIADSMMRQFRLAQGKRVVVVGGGTGLSSLLRGIKQHTTNISAIVTVTDDGGSSGQLRQNLGILPPGDIRNCLVALAEAEPELSALFQYRFDKMPQLQGHAFGNLFLAAMTGITGDFESALRKTSQVLAIGGRVLPSTLHSVKLKAEMEDGSWVEGETAIVDSPLRIRRLYLDPPDVKPLDEALNAIAEADIIVMGPGSVYTSVIPNLLVKQIADRIHMARAVRVYVCNVMTQPGETDHYAASDHVKAVEAHVGKRVFDSVLLNNGQPSQALVEKYRNSGQVLVASDPDRVRAMGYKPIVGNFISETDVVRHDPGRLAEAIFRIAR